MGAAVASEQGGLWVNVEPVAEGVSATPIEEPVRELRAVLQNVAELRNSRRLPEILRTIAEPGALADAVTAWSEAAAEHQIDVLEAVDVGERLAVVLTWAREHLAELQVARQIRDGVADGVEKQQREFLLRQQLQAIRKELGDSDDEAGDDYRAKFDALPLPVKVREAVDKELDRLERTSGQSPEQGWIRTWLDRVLDLPWGKTTEDRLDLSEARAVLDADHEGLDDVKERIVEFLAVRKLRTERGLAASPEATDDDTPKPAPRRGDGAIVALVGPPGVGKTSLGESVARAMGRSFVRVALGGVRDEAEIRGHRRTYVGSQPGRIVRAIGEAGTMNPVVLLDEVDKLSAGGWSGDPTAALLEVLDPAQNHTFRDHYLEVELDLSDVVFIATANVIDTIPGPLLDRMELVRLDGYTEDEKVVIGRNHLLVRQLERTGLRADEVELTDDALRRIITDYTREAGVRSLERELAKLLRKVDHQGRRRRHRHAGGGRRRRRRRLPRPRQVPRRGGRAHRGARRGDRPGGHRGRWRRAVHRGRGVRRRAGADADRSAGRRDEGVGPDRPLLRAVPCRRSWPSILRRPTAGSTSTCRLVRSPRTARRRASP